MSETAKCKCGRPIHENFGDQRMYYGRYNHVYENGQRDSTHYWHKAEPAVPAQEAPRGLSQQLKQDEQKQAECRAVCPDCGAELPHYRRPAEAGAQVPPPRLQYQMWKGDNGLDYVDMRDYRSLEARSHALEDALRWVKAWFAKLEDNTDPLDHVLKDIRQRVHAPIHAVIDAALEGRER
jgi:hypothetical protein